MRGERGKEGQKLTGEKAGPSFRAGGHPWTVVGRLGGLVMEHGSTEIILSQ